MGEDFVGGGLRCPIMAKFGMGMRKVRRRLKISYQFHELQNVKAHPDGFRQGGSVPTINTGLGGPDHSLDIAISHWSAMTFESFPKILEETRGVPDAVVDFLLNQLRV